MENTKVKLTSFMITDTFYCSLAFLKVGISLLELSGESAGIGCPKENDGQTVTLMPQEAAVRCCSLSGISCITPGGHDAEQYGGCLEKTTFEEAEGKCASINMRLCTLEELESNLCCGTGCEFDMKPTWHKRGKSMVC